MTEPSGPKRAEVLKLKEMGLSNSLIGHTLGISRQRVGQIVNGSKSTRPAFRKAQDLLSTAQVARLLNVHTNTIRRWSNASILPTYRIGLRGDRRFRRVDVQRLLSEGFIKSVPQPIEPEQGLQPQPVRE
jgi:excisionase family DNA binding protein